MITAASFKAAPQTQKPDFSKLTEDFVYGSLALSPNAATQAGYHEHQGVNLDGKLDDFSPAGLDAQRNFYQGFKTRLAAIDQKSLSAEDRADYLIAIAHDVAARQGCEVDVVPLDGPAVVAFIEPIVKLDER